MKLNTIYNEDCLDTMKRMPDGFVDLVVTSPPYDDLRTYNGYSFEFGTVAEELFRVIKCGRMVAWVLGDSRKNWDRRLTPFKQILMLHDIGFKIPDIFIYQTDSGKPMKNWYSDNYQLMPVCFKGDRPQVVNVLKTKAKYAGTRHGGMRRARDGSFQVRANNPVPKMIDRSNIWRYPTGMNKSSKDKIAFKHPAVFPERLASDHIQSWSNPSDLVYDPFMGSGTTAKMAKKLGRKYLGSEISTAYCEIAEKRLAQEVLI